MTFTWRHWGLWTGDYADIAPTGEVIESFGAAIATVTDDLKIQKIEVYYDPNPFLLQFKKYSKGKCPFQHMTKC